MNAAPVGVAADGRAGSGDDDSFRRCGKRGADAGVEHAEDMRFRIETAERLHGNRRDGVAGDDDHFHSAVEQKRGVFAGKTADGIHGFVAVRHTGGIAEIKDVFIGESAVHGGGDGQPAESGIEHADRSVVSLVRHFGSFRSAFP